MTLSTRQSLVAVCLLTLFVLGCSSEKDPSGQNVQQSGDGSTSSTSSGESPAKDDAPDATSSSTGKKPAAGQPVVELAGLEKALKEPEEWKVIEGTRLGKIETEGEILGAAFAPDGTRIYVADGDVGIGLHDPKTYERTGTWEWQGEPLLAMELSEDGSTLVTRDEAHVIRVWDTSTGKVRTTYEKHQEEIPILLVSPNGGMVISSEEEPQSTNLIQYIAWDSKTGEQVWTKETRWRAPKVGAFSPDGSMVALYGKEFFGSVLICDAQTGDTKQELKCDCRGLERITFSPDSKQLVMMTVSSDTEPRPMALLPLPVTQPSWLINSGSAYWDQLKFSPDGKYVIAIGSYGDKYLSIWDAKSGKQFATFKDGFDVEYLAIAPDGKSMITADGDSGAIVWQFPHSP